MVYPVIVRGALGISFAFFLFTESKLIRYSSILLFTLFFILTVKSHSQLFIQPRKLEKKLQSLDITGVHSLDFLKKEYESIHNLYDKLSNKHQRKYHGSLDKVRERIETKMRAGKKIEELLQKVGVGGIEKQQKNYEEMLEIYQKLPQGIQKEYYAEIMHAKDRLEKGLS